MAAVAVAVISCWKYRSRWDVLRRTWLPALEARRVPYRIVVGGPRPPGGRRRRAESERAPGGLDDVDDEDDEDEEVDTRDVLEVDAPDTYEGLPAKVLAAVAAVSALGGAEWVYKVDDDCYVHVPRLLWACERYSLEHDAWGHLIGPGVDRTWHYGKCQDDALNTTPFAGPTDHMYFNGGASYLLGRAAADAVAAARADDHPLELYEDHLVGKLLKGAGVELFAGLWEMAPTREAAEMSLCVLGSEMCVMVRPTEVLRDRPDLREMCARHPLVFVYADCPMEVLQAVHETYQAVD